MTLVVFRHPNGRETDADWFVCDGPSVDAPSEFDAVATALARTLRDELTSRGYTTFVAPDALPDAHARWQRDIDGVRIFCFYAIIGTESRAPGFWTRAATFAAK